MGRIKQVKKHRPVTRVDAYGVPFVDYEVYYVNEYVSGSDAYSGSDYSSGGSSSDSGSSSSSSDSGGSSGGGE